MSGASIVIIAGGGGGRVNTEYDTTYQVQDGDTAENESGGAVELHFVGVISGPAVIPVPGYSGHQFTEAGSFQIFQ